jgi:hypothetical protein
MEGLKNPMEYTKTAISVFIIGIMCALVFGSIGHVLMNVRENQIKAMAENPELFMSKDDIVIRRMTSIVDNFTELNKKLEEVIEVQKQQNEAMKQELNSRIQNYPRTHIGNSPRNV